MSDATIDGTVYPGIVERDTLIRQLAVIGITEKQFFASTFSQEKRIAMLHATAGSIMAMKPISMSMSVVRPAPETPPSA